MRMSGLEEEPPKEPIPRIWMVPASAPGAPPAVVTVTPGAMPCRAVEAWTIGREPKSAVETVATEPVRLTFFWVS